MVDFLATFDFNSIVLSDKDISDYIDMVKPAITQKTKEDIIKNHNNVFQNNILTASLCVTEDTTKGFALNENALQPTHAMRLLTKEEIIENLQHIKAALLVYSFVYGNYNATRSWIRYKPGNYIRLDGLKDTGKHGVMVTVFMNEISHLLEIGKDNALTNALKRNNIEIHPSKRKYCFPRGHFLNEVHREAIQKDLNKIFENFKKPIPNRDYKNLVFFNERSL